MHQGSARVVAGKRLAAALGATLALAGATAASASAAVTFTNPAVVTIPANAMAAASTPYPSSIAVGTLTGTVQKATVTLLGYSHTCSNDVQVLLVSPSGAKSTVFSHPGPGSGCPPSVNQDLTFDQAAASDLPYPPVTGTWKPTEGDPPLPFDPPAPAGPYPLSLDEFNGTNPNGTWNLFVGDFGGGDDGSLSRGWSLTLTGPVPSNSLTVGEAALNKKKGTANLPVTLPNPGTLTGSGNGAKVSRSVTAGKVSLLVKAKGKKKRTLLETGKVKLRVAITYTPSAGSPPTAGPAVTQTVKVKLKKNL